MRNLKVYFEHEAISLTTDLSEIEEWQGGDIVIFQDHIGIVSDRRNENGVPYVIHHNSPWQKNMSRIFWRREMTWWDTIGFPNRLSGKTAGKLKKMKDTVKETERYGGSKVL